jgi:hypothetical protein
MPSHRRDLALHDRMTRQMTQQVDKVAGLADQAAAADFALLRPVLGGTAPALTV